MAPAKQQRLIGTQARVQPLLNVHKALTALGGDHSVANLQLGEFDWENAEKEYPEQISFRHDRGWDALAALRKLPKAKPCE
jgi:hypothetical protein